MQFIALLIALSVLAIFATAGKVVYPARTRLPANWEQSSTKLDPNFKLHLRIALHPKDPQTLEKKLIQIATPGTSVFRQYLKKHEITAIVGREESEINQVADFFNQYGVKLTSVHPHRDWIFVEATVEQVEKIFECQLASYFHKKMGYQRVGAVGGYSIPAEITNVVKFVAGMTTFSFSRWEPVAALHSENGVAVNAPVTPQTIYDNYLVPNTGTHGSKLGSQAVVEFGQLANYNDADLQTFFKTYQTSLTGETVSMASGSNNGEIRASVEANLDVQYIMAAGPHVNTTDYKITGTGSIEDEFLDYTILVNSQNDPPLSHSISYGEYGGSYDNVTDQQFSYELQKMGISGISVLLASGDNGVGCDAAGTTQEFDYPSSPYITMVGATQLDAATKKEVGATLSSGGFSKDFMQASWQADAVNAYLNSDVQMPHEDFYAPGRAYPDLAAYGQNVQVTAAGKTSSVAGTSCSAPIVAGLVANLNDELLKAGHAPLGFLNPWLYAHPEMFTDVTEGSNPYQKCDGFYASAGWDPVTGLGTPLYPQWKAAAFADAVRAAKK